ncbi:MAG: DUF86 domain-containing protein [Scytolyngbya sp. HA4215-MV1]|jgi:uncharacterized protein with HEPN domain|nr:DUF86 domain-containing protein [Scytolyngbya sp. HA4215-MV1]
MSPRDLDYVADILAAARLIQTFLVGRDWSGFETDLMCQSIRQLEIIGEATKRLSVAFRDHHPDLPWQKMAGMRDILIHAYDAVDLDEVWNAANQSIPRLIEQLEPPGSL